MAPSHPVTRFSVKFATHYTPIREILALAVRAEALGYHSVWSTEGRMAPDSITTTAAIAALTRSVRIGTSVVNPYSRTTGLIAISAASIDQISRGRFVLGIGTGDPPTLEQQRIHQKRPLVRLEECIAVLRALWAGESVDYSGETLEISGLKMDFRPYRESIPVYMAAIGPRALRLANRIADGILLTVCVPEPSVRELLAVVDRRRGVKVIRNVVVGMHPRSEIAVREAKPHIVRYLTKFPSIARVSGIPQAIVDTLREAAAQGIERACAVLPDRYVTQLAAVGTPEECREWIKNYTAGMDEVLLTPMSGDARMIVEELAGLLGS